LWPRHFISPFDGRLRAAHFTLPHFAATPVQAPMSVQVRVGDPTIFVPLRQPYVHIFPTVVPVHLIVPLLGLGGFGHSTLTHLVPPAHFPVERHLRTPFPGGRKPAGQARLQVFPASVPSLQLATAPFPTFGFPQLTGVHSATVPDHAPLFLHLRCLLFLSMRTKPALQAKLHVLPTVVPLGQSTNPFGGGPSFPQSLGLHSSGLPLHSSLDRHRRTLVSPFSSNP